MNAYQLKMGKGPWAGTTTLFHVKRPDVTPIDVKELGVTGVEKPPRRTFRHDPHVSRGMTDMSEVDLIMRAHATEGREIA